MTECYFNNIDWYIKRKLEKAEKNVIIVVAWINTSLFEDIFRELIEKGVSVSILYNDDFINKRIIKKQDKINYVPIKMPNKKNKMHDKFCIIDNKLVISGSYNWSKNANDNFENIIITDDRIVVAKFLNEYHELSNVKSLYEDARELCRCKECGRKAFRLGVIQTENEEKCEDRVDIIEVCTFDTGHNRFVESVNYQGLTNFLNQDDNRPNYYLDGEYEDEEVSKETNFINELAENQRTNELLEFFNNNNEWNIHFHALAYKHCDNYSAYIEGYESFENWIYKVVWKNKFLANKIEDEYELLTGL